MTKNRAELRDAAVVTSTRIGEVPDPARRKVLHSMVGAAGAASLGLGATSASAAGGELVVAIPNNPSTFDPTSQANHDAMVVTQTIFENLVTVDEEGVLQPQLARSLPKISNGGKTYLFELREGVTFQNGQPFSANDVKYSFDYVLDPKNNALRRPLFNRIEQVVVEDKYRVRFEMRQPYRPFLYYMTKYMGIFPAGSREKHDANYFKSTPIGLGTGPGIFVEWRQNDRVILRRNPNYWRKGVPNWERAVIRTIPDESARIAYLMTGNVDIISAPNPRDLLSLKQRSEVTVGERLALGGWFFLMLNDKKPPFDDLNFRRAIAAMIDRQMLAKKVYHDMVVPASIPAPPGSWWFDAEADGINRLDPARAREFLKKSKYARGAEFDMLVPSQPYLVDVKDAAVVIQAQLAEIGIKVNIKEMEPGILLQQARLGNHVAALQVWMSPGEPTFMIDLCYGKDNVFSKSSGYENPVAWKLINDTYLETDEAALKPIFAELLRLLANDSPHVWLGFVRASNVWRNNVTGFKVNQGLTMRIANAGKR
ncbi:MAG: ABC transporter substrate-binding protein [Burkholderiaceae bacterium]|nr:ABC transporter substrate-binding protein [Burkholderiaceae bacterium]